MIFARRTRWFLHLFTLLLDKSCRWQECFLKCKTNKVIPIYKLDFCISRCISQKYFKFIYEFYLFYYTLAIECCRYSLVFALKIVGVLGSMECLTSLFIVKVCICYYFLVVIGQWSWFLLWFLKFPPVLWLCFFIFSMLVFSNTI